MKIGLVCPYAWNVPGGVQQHVRGLAEALIGLGHDVSVLTPVEAPGDVPARSGATEPLPPYAVAAGNTVPVPYNGSVARLSFGFRPAGRVRRWLREGQFDVLHVHEPAAPSLSLLACWAAEEPIVATLHTSIDRSRALAAGYPVLHTALAKIRGRIAVSEAAHGTFAGFRGSPALIPNGVQIRRFARSEPLPGWPGGGGTLGFLGRLDEPRKGLRVLLEAFHLLAPERPGLRLLLAGPGYGDEVARTLPSGLRGRVTLLGRVSERDKERFYRSVDAFVAPNVGGESFGVILAEAMAAGAPIVASDIPAFRRVLRDGRAGVLFRAGDAAGLSAAVSALLDDPDARAWLAGRALSVVSAYDWPVVARDVLRVYEAVAPGGADRRTLPPGPARTMRP